MNTKFHQSITSHKTESGSPIDRIAPREVSAPALSFFDAGRTVASSAFYPWSDPP